MMEIIYIAYKDGKLFAYSFDLDGFMHYLRDYYMVHDKGRIEICKKRVTDKMQRMQIESPEYEIIQFYKGIYLTAFEAEFLDKYLRGFYHSATKLLNRNLHSIKFESFEEFLDYLGEENIRKNMERVDYDAALEDYKLTREFLAIISTNK